VYESIGPHIWSAGGGDHRAVAVLAHGAGAGMRHPFVEGAAAGLAGGGVDVLRFEFPYMAAGRRRPDPARVLLDSWRSAIAAGLERAGRQRLPLVLGGKSLGGRMASMLAAEEGPGLGAAAVVFFGYPLHAPGKDDQRRDGHLSSITVPMLFIEGTLDPFARFDLMTALVERLAPLARLHSIEGGDHSFRQRGRRRPDEEIGAELGSVAAAFILEVVG